MCLSSKSEQSVCPVSINVPSFDLSPGSLPPSVLNPELSVCPVPVLESNIERFVCPTTLNEINTEFAALSVTAQRPAFAPLNPPVLSQETINAPHDSHVNSVTAIEPIYELSCPVSVSEPFVNCFVFPAMAPETMNALPVLSVSALPVLSVSVLPRSRSLPWIPAQSASLRWSSVRSAPLRWSSAQVWWSSAPPWGLLLGSGGLLLRPGGLQSRLLRPGGLQSAPPWWAPVPSALPWWAPVPSTPPWLPALPTLPRSTATPLPRGPGPLSLPLFRLRSTALLDCIGASGSRSWGGGGLCHESCPCTSVHSPPEVTRSPH